MENRPITGIPNNQTQQVNPLNVAPVQIQQQVSHQSQVPVQHSRPVTPTKPKREPLDLSEFNIKTSTIYGVIGGVVGLVLGLIIATIFQVSIAGYGFVLGCIVGYGVGYMKDKNGL